MRDGVRLYGVLYHPSQGDCFPVLLIRSIYDTQHPRYVEWASRFARSGYAVVLQDCRGRYESEGEWRPYIDEAQDGFDTQQWIGAQPWCDGNIGTFGISYPGFTQVLPAPLRSPFVKALVPIANQEDNYGHFRCDGVLQLQNAMNFIWLGNRTKQEVARNLVDWSKVYRSLPLITALDEIADRPFYRDIIRHSCFDEFWKSYSMKEKYSDVEVPAYFITGWYDNLVREMFRCFHGWKTQARTAAARKQTKLMVGPWTHSQIGGPVPGDITMGPDAIVDIPAEHLRWYDRRLKGIRNGLDEEAPIRLFVMGENRWRDEWEWPLARTEYRKFYLHSGGRANSMFGDGELSTSPGQGETPDRFSYDPENPVPTLGGQSMFVVDSGPRDRRPVERRDDVLVYSTPPLTQSIEVTGPIVVILYASSSQLDTDFTATLVNVQPGGAAINLCEGVVRARFRESFERPTLMEPGTIYKFEISLWETSNLFKVGHCIRLDISSSNFPRFDRNLNTGSTPGLDSDIRVAHQTIYHDANHPSCLLLPVIPR